MPTSFSYSFLRLFTFPMLLLQSLRNPKILLLLPLLLPPLPLLSYYFATKYFAADIKFLGVVELKTQLLILENILWLPLCRINKFVLNTLPSKTVAIPYTCGLSMYHLTFDMARVKPPLSTSLMSYPAFPRYSNTLDC